MVQATGLRRLAMRVLCRVAAALLIAIPVFLILTIVFALAGRRHASLPLEGEDLISLERDVAAGPYFHARKVISRVTR
jgi:hypothetical protein